MTVKLPNLLKMSEYALYNNFFTTIATIVFYHKRATPSKLQVWFIKNLWCCVGLEVERKKLDSNKLRENVHYNRAKMKIRGT